MSSGTVQQSVFSSLQGLLRAFTVLACMLGVSRERKNHGRIEVKVLTQVNITIPETCLDEVGLLFKSID